jgi:hypothetical protein
MALQHGFQCIQTPTENSKQAKSKAKPSTQANPAPDQASKPSKQSKPSKPKGKPKNNGQGFDLVSDTKKQQAYKAKKPRRAYSIKQFFKSLSVNGDK